MVEHGRLSIFLTASGAKAITAALLFLRAKAVALMLGPEGVGLLGLYTAAQEIGAQAADGGLSHSSVREVARRRNRPDRAARLRRSLAVAIIAAAAIAAVLTWCFRRALSEALTGGQTHADAFGLLSVGIALTIFFRWRQSLVIAYGQVMALSRAVVVGTATATLIGTILIWMFGSEGLIWATIATPAAGLVALAFVRLPPVGSPTGRMTPDWARLARLGVPLMLIAQMSLIAPMLIRIGLTHQDGLDQAGYFQAAWTISAHCMTILLTAVAMDFYPKISALSDDRGKVSDCIRDQLSLHLTFGAPILLLIAGFAPLVLTVLFSGAFSAAAPLLHGLMVGGLARLVSAPLETVLTAFGRPRAVVISSILSLGLLLSGSWIGYGQLGLIAIAIAFAAANLAHLALMIWFTQAHLGIAVTHRTLAWLAVLFGLSLLLIAVPQIAYLMPTLIFLNPSARRAIRRRLTKPGRDRPNTSVSSATPVSPAAAPRRP